MFQVCLPERDPTDCFAVQPTTTTLTVEWFPLAPVPSSTDNNSGDLCLSSGLSYTRPASLRLMRHLSLPRTDLARSLLLSGPRGSGKTRLLRSWASHCPPGVLLLYTSVLEVQEGSLSVASVEEEEDGHPAWLVSLAALLSRAFSQDVRPSSV